MSKKMMLLALAVVSAAAFALPAGSSAAELHLTNVTTFSGTFGAGTLTAAGEPIITCGDVSNSNHVTGEMNVGGTTGTIVLDYTACHTSVFGFTAKCHTEGSPADNTIKSGGSFHLITIEPSAGVVKPAILVTPEHTTIICAGISNTTVTGNVIGTIIEPSCGGSSNSLTMKFKATGATQEHMKYTGVNYDLTAQTSGGPILTAGLNSEENITSTSATTGTLDCT